MENSNRNYKIKYFKYKAKYENIKTQYGGAQKTIFITFNQNNYTEEEQKASIKLTKTKTPLIKSLEEKQKSNSQVILPIVYSIIQTTDKLVNFYNNDDYYGILSQYIQFFILATLLKNNKSYNEIKEEYMNTDLYELVKKYKDSIKYKGVIKPYSWATYMMIYYSDIIDSDIDINNTVILKTKSNIKLNIIDNIIFQYKSTNFIDNIIINYIEINNFKDLALLKNPDLRYESWYYIELLITNLIKNQQILINNHIFNRSKSKLEVILTLDTIKKLLEYSNNLSEIGLSELLDKILNFNLIEPLVKDNIPILDIIKFLKKIGVNPNMNYVGSSIDKINKLIQKVEYSYSQNDDLGNPRDYEKLIYDIQNVLIKDIKTLELEEKEEKERQEKEKNELQERQRIKKNK